MIRTHFSELLQVVPKAPLELYITGTDRRTGAQSIDIVLRAYAPHRFVAGNEGHFVSGYFVFAETGFVLRNYTEQETAQPVREHTYKVISDFLGKWQESAVLSNPQP